MKYELFKCAAEGSSAKTFYSDLLKPLLDLFPNIMLVMQLGDTGMTRTGNGCTRERN